MYIYICLSISHAHTHTHTHTQARTRMNAAMASIKQYAVIAEYYGALQFIRFSQQRVLNTCYFVLYQRNAPLLNYLSFGVCFVSNNLSLYEKEGELYC